MLYIISVNSMYTNTTWGGFYMFSFRGVSECVMYLRKQKGTTIVDLGGVGHYWQVRLMRMLASKEFNAVSK